MPLTWGCPGALISGLNHLAGGAERQAGGGDKWAGDARAESLLLVLLMYLTVHTSAKGESIALGLSKVDMDALIGVAPLRYWMPWYIGVNRQCAICTVGSVADLTGI